ncbi:MAG: Mut7-C RNAse domain-containing protein [Planctomycetes bacterium]|nr:Mut7-C RNAse domain-containing protein [Planctomycetota bacterium]
MVAMPTENSTGCVAFLADEMLGRLARHLRMAGIDCLHVRSLGVERIREAARAERRIVLTRSRRLAEDPELARVLLLESGNPYDQMVEVCRAFGIDPTAAALSRCSLCNEPLVCAPKAEVAAEVPPRAYAARDEFWRCPRCRRIYWGGSHAREILDRFERIRSAAVTGARSGS